MITINEQSEALILIVIGALLRRYCCDTVAAGLSVAIITINEQSEEALILIVSGALLLRYFGDTAALLWRYCGVTAAILRRYCGVTVALLLRYCGVIVALLLQQDCVSLEYVQQSMDTGLQQHDSMCDSPVAFSSVQQPGITNLMMACNVSSDYHGNHHHHHRRRCSWSCSCSELSLLWFWWL
jgi:hypothetical protein